MTVAALDIECEDWDKFVVGALRYPSGDVAISWDADHLYQAIRAYEGDVWTWAGARYDSLWVAEMAARYGDHATARLSGGVVTLVIGRARIRDGFRLFPTSLAKAAALAGVSKVDTGLPCRCYSHRQVTRMRALISATGRDPDGYGAHVRAASGRCGGYCAIRRVGMSPEHKRRLENYLARDVDVTARVIASLQGFAAEHGIVLKSTVASSAWATLKAMGAPKADWPSWRDYHHVRLAYFGGRTELYRRSTPFIWRADIHSAYPGALINVPVPVGDYRHLAGHEAAAKAFEAGKPGCFSCVVTVPECFCPPLPIRSESRLAFPVGTMHGTWCGLELAHAVACGARIEKFTEAYAWDREERVCAPFMAKFWGLRASLGKDSPQGKWLKWFVNAPTGGFALKPTGEQAHVCDASEAKGCPHDGECYDGALHGMMQACCVHVCRETCGRWLPVGPRGVVWSAKMHQLSDRSHIQWAMTLTAATRIKLHERQLACGDDLVYSDTDSCYARRRIAEGLGHDVGTWSDEGLGLDWYARGPKAYTYADGGNPYESRPPTFEFIARAKGVPLTPAEFESWSEGNPVELPAGVWGFKGAARRGGSLFAKRTGADGLPYARAARSNPMYAGSRVVNPDGSTRPMDWDEFRTLEKQGAFGL